MKRKLLNSLVAFLVGGFFLNSGNVLAQEKPAVIKWKLQTTYSTSSVIGRNAITYAKAIEKLTNGRLQIQVFESGTFCSPAEIPNALNRGLMDIGVSYGGFHVGTIPEAEVESGLPWAWMTHSEVWEVYHTRGMLKVMQEAYAKHNILFNYVSADQYYNFVTNFPIKNMNSLKGKKLRATGAYGKYTKALGAAPTVIAAGDLYMALKLKTIDGALYSVSGADDFKIGEVCSTFVFPTCSVAVGGIYISMKSLKALPDDLRAIVTEATPYISTALSHDIYQANELAWLRLQKKGMKKYVLSEKEIKEQIQLSRAIWDEVAAKSPLSAKCVEIIKGMLKDHNRL